MQVFCLDIGNTSAHWGVVDQGEPVVTGSLPGRASADRVAELQAVLDRVEQEFELSGIAWCSVVPALNARVEAMLEQHKLPILHLSATHCPGLPIRYPRPAEIGQDRLANTIAAQALFGAPAVVIDMGTAVTLDVLTPDGGYEGGIIAPGLEVMTRYLHQQTALLPDLNPDDLLFSAGIGRSTIEAMKLGCAVGFSGMIEALLKRVLEEMASLGHHRVSVVATGGSVGNLPRAWLDELQFDPDLTLKGLAEAFRRTESVPHSN